MSKRRILNLCLGIILVGCLLYLFANKKPLLAEKSGGSPESGTTSYISALYTSLASLGYGSTAAGSWGDWGAYWNRIRSAAEKPFNDAVAKGLWNGSGTGTADCNTTADGVCYTKALGGLDDYNDGNAIPTDSYQQSWITCNSSNNYCETGRSVAEKQDPNTGLVWSPRVSSSANWFTANNCKYPNGLAGDDGICNSNNEVACICVKHTGTGGDTKTGCEAYDDGNWRLPTQKELLQAYIDGSRGALSNAAANHWSATTASAGTQNAWGTNLSTGFTTSYTKSDYYSYRCVR